MEFSGGESNYGAIGGLFDPYTLKSRDMEKLVDVAKACEIEPSPRLFEDLLYVVYGRRLEGNL